MKTRWLGTLAIGLLLVGVLAGCTTTAASRAIAANTKISGVNG